MVAFRGSTELLNWIADMWVTPERWPRLTKAYGSSIAPCPGCGVHSGFSHAFEELAHEMEAALRSLSCRHIGIAGHSLGAAVSALAAFWLRSHRSMDVRVDPVYLFGMPRVGNAVFARAFEDTAAARSEAPSAWRVVNGLDPVPRLWPRGKPYDYTHFGLEVYYPPSGASSRVCIREEEDPDCMIGEPFWRCILNLGDHVHYLNLTFDDSISKTSCTGWWGRAEMLSGEAWKALLAWVQAAQLFLQSVHPNVSYEEAKHAIASAMRNVVEPGMDSL